MGLESVGRDSSSHSISGAVLGGGCGWCGLWLRQPGARDASGDRSRGEEGVRAPSHLLPPSLQPTNFTNPVYATLYMGAHNSRNSLASTDEKRELLSRGADDDLADPLA